MPKAKIPPNYYTYYNTEKIFCPQYKQKFVIFWQGMGVVLPSQTTNNPAIPYGERWGEGIHYPRRGRRRDVPHRAIWVFSNGRGNPSPTTNNPVIPYGGRWVEVYVTLPDGHKQGRARISIGSLPNGKCPILLRITKNADSISAKCPKRSLKNLLKMCKV